MQLFHSLAQSLQTFSLLLWILLSVFMRHCGGLTGATANHLAVIYLTNNASPKSRQVNPMTWFNSMNRWAGMSRKTWRTALQPKTTAFIKNEVSFCTQPSSQPCTTLVKKLRLDRYVSRVIVAKRYLIYIMCSLSFFSLCSYVNTDPNNIDLFFY